MSIGIDPTQLGLDLGTGGVIGGVMGFAAKKIAKVVAVLVGLQLAAFKFLESQGILAVDWEKLSAGMLSAGDTAASSQPPDFLMSVLSTLSVSGGFAAGFMAGFKLG
ncbi:FUN14 domain-containing protein [Halomarina litorea]|uniref:FUN14 domain-containing protein n=1 Tax=Halomarina litorea TaxID=2961595 RepID=UPI0020C2979B|nr:FUN14 domain-containing protein [Halomarina sp. BCD28]